MIAQKELEIKILNLTVAGKIAESNAQIALLKLKQSELDISSPLYAEKLAAYDLGIKSAEAAILQAKATGEGVEALERELKVLKESSIYRGQNVKNIGLETSARRSAVSATDEHSDAMERLLMKYKLSADYSKRQVEMLQEEVRTGAFKVRKDSAFVDEANKTVWARNDQDELTRKIDDDTFHPDMLDAILYSLRFVWINYGKKS